MRGSPHVRTSVRYPGLWAGGNELAAEARRRIEGEHGKSVGVRWPTDVWDAIRALESAIAETEDLKVAEWTVSRWILGAYMSLEEIVELERVETPKRLAERAERERRLAAARASLPGIRP